MRERCFIFARKSGKDLKDFLLCFVLFAMGLGVKSLARDFKKHANKKQRKERKKKEKEREKERTKERKRKKERKKRKKERKSRQNSANNKRFSDIFKRSLS